MPRRFSDVRPLILVTSFEPFGGSPVNPTVEIAELLKSMGAEVGSRRYLTLPVVGGIHPGSAWHLAANGIAELEPDAVVALGESLKADRIHVETRAVNVRDNRIADNAGVRVTDEPVVAGAPAELFSTLSATDLVHACRSCGVPARLSTHAGTFLCNELMFRLLHHAEGPVETAARSFVAGFIHVPQLPAQAQQRGGVSMDARTATNGVHAILEWTASHLARDPD